MDEFVLIDNSLIKIKGQIESLLDYNSYKYKAPNVRILQFRLDVDEYLLTMLKDLGELDRIQYLMEQVTDLRDNIDEKYSRGTFTDLPNSFRKEQKVALQSINNTINSFLSQLSKELLEASNLADVRNEDVALSSSQVALFILYLRDVKMISDKLSDSKVAEYFGKMTGYSQDQLRKTISGVNRFERNQITHLEANYNDLKELLGTIIERIETDKRKSILKKDK